MKPPKNILQKNVDYCEALVIYCSKWCIISELQENKLAWSFLCRHTINSLIPVIAEQCGYES